MLHNVCIYLNTVVVPQLTVVSMLLPPALQCCGWRQKALGKWIGCLIIFLCFAICTTLLTLHHSILTWNENDRCAGIFPPYKDRLGKFNWFDFYLKSEVRVPSSSACLCVRKTHPLVSFPYSEVTSLNYSSIIENQGEILFPKKACVWHLPRAWAFKAWWTVNLKLLLAHNKQVSQS